VRAIRWPAEFQRLSSISASFELLLDGGRTLRVHDGGVRAVPSATGDDFALDLGALQLAASGPAACGEFARARGLYGAGKIEVHSLELDGDLVARPRERPTST
jgi:hypothetical protein